jgi:hypothetical protein
MRISVKEASVLILAAVGVVAFRYFPLGQTVTAEAPAAPTAAQTAQRECAKKELLDYSQASIARFNEQAGSVARMLSVESILAERRLQEQHCERLASCFFSDPHSLEYAASFSACLAPESARENDH